MNKQIITALFATVIASPAFALHETNCSNADGSLRRVEREIWGANLVEYVVRTPEGKEIVLKDIRVEDNFDESTKVSLNKSTGNFAGYEEETYAIKLTVARSDGGEIYRTVVGGDAVSTVRQASDLVICKAWSNGGRD